MKASKTDSSKGNLLSTDERRRVLLEWNNTRKDFPGASCVHQLFEEQVEKTPDAVALVLEGRALSYRELNRRANQLAHHLRAQGVKPDVPVGLCVDRSLEMGIGLLGILKAGGGYVPLDPGYPQDRLEYMMRNNGNSLTVTQAALVKRLPARMGKIICFEALPAMAREDNPLAHVSPANLAYILYTSGSTGQPKGVAMEHGPLVNLMRWQLEDSAVGLSTLQFASLNFDVSFQEFFSTWLSGGTLFLIDPHTRLNPTALWEYVATHKLERLFLPVVMLQRLVEAAGRSQKDAPRLREVITAGEQLRITPAIREFFAARPDCRLQNQYGPTESHVVTAWTLPPTPAQWPESPPIGTPIANTNIYLLDAKMNPVPPGSPGELYIGGAVLARGYWNQSERTAERFVPDPFASLPGARLFRTGDQARHLPNGCIEYLGRLDHQVKIRGFRVELEEVESRLAAHPDVSSGAVVVQADRTGVPGLTAFVVPRSGAILSAENLRSWLAQKLPEFMLPSRFAVMDALPLTPNGKLDRGALAKREDVTSLAAGTEHVPAATELEHQLAHIWQDVLRQDRISVVDDFFELGGHSLLGAEVLKRIHDQTGVMLPLSRFFESPRIRPLAQRIEAERERSRSVSVPAGLPSEQAPLFQVGWLLNLEAANLAGRPYYVIPFPKFEHSVKECRVEFLAENCLQRLKAIQPKGPYMLMGYSLAGLVAFEMACRLRAEGETVTMTAIIDIAPYTALHRVAPAIIGRVGSKLGVPFRVQITLARFWFYILDKSRHLARLVGPDWRGGWRRMRIDFEHLSKLWRRKRPRPGHLAPSRSSPQNAGQEEGFFGRRGFAALWPHVWALAAYQPKRYDGAVGLFVSDDLADEYPQAGRGWSPWTPNLREYSIPGDHRTAITTHKDVLTRKLAECFAATGT